MLKWTSYVSADPGSNPGTRILFILARMLDPGALDLTWHSKFQEAVEKSDLSMHVSSLCWSE